MLSIALIGCSHHSDPRLSRLEQSLRQASGSKPDNAEKKEPVPSPAPVDSKDKAQVIREHLKNKLMALYKSNDANNEVSNLILQSESYRKLLDAILFIYSGVFRIFVVVK